jgi:uncharacterized protein YyaL (SSP411 family)
MINNLQTSRSLYLLQHAAQPINWQIWEKKSLDLAIAQNKPILLSVGYSSCHWCHVMSREVFEDITTAEFINKHFIPIKVDREERPDIDQVYTAAVKAMGVQVGWPMNLFLLPNQRPFYVVNYVELANWQKLLHSIIDAFNNHREALEESGKNFMQSLLIAWQPSPHSLPKKVELMDMALWYASLLQHLDMKNGGLLGAPKFPLSSLANFLLSYYDLLQDKTALESHNLMLTKIAQGGIYDHIDGGFSRYATDEFWRIPHFEKMFYDNALLVSAYSHGYFNSQDPTYKQCIVDTLAFCMSTMSDNYLGVFYNSVDASEGEQEGDFYLWTQDEIEKILEPGDAKVITHYYNISKSGNWHSGYNVLLVDEKNNKTISQHDIYIISQAKKKLYSARLKRKQPTVDKKIISTHQGMAIVALIDAYIAIGNEDYLDSAIRTASFVRHNLILNNNSLVRIDDLKDQELSEGFLDSYAWIIKAFTALYQFTLDRDLIRIADDLLRYVLQNFADTESSLLYYSSSSTSQLICRSKDIYDTPIPSSNAIMAENLLCLGLVLDNHKYMRLSCSMTYEIKSKLDTEIQYLSHWALIILYQITIIPVIAISGVKAKNWAQAIKTNFMNRVIVRLLGDTDSIGSLMKNSTLSKEKTAAHICIGDICLRPIEDLENTFLKLRKILDKAKKI